MWNLIIKNNQIYLVLFQVQTLWTMMKANMLGFASVEDGD